MNPDCETYRKSLNAFLDEEGSAEAGHELNCLACSAYKSKLIEMKTIISENREIPLSQNLIIKVLAHRVTPLPSNPTVSQPQPLSWFSGWVGNFCLVTVTVVFLTFLLFRGMRGKNPILKSLKSGTGKMTDSVFNLSAKLNASFTFRSGSTLTIWGGPAKITFDQNITSYEGKSAVGCSLDEGHACFSYESGRSEILLVSIRNIKVIVRGTTFRISREKNGETLIEVAQGKIQVTTFQKTLDLPALQRVLIDRQGSICYVKDFNAFLDPEFGVSFSEISKGSR